jgi:hypothetical protein
MERRWVVFLAILAIVAVVVASCGGAIVTSVPITGQVHGGYEVTVTPPPSADQPKDGGEVSVSTGATTKVAVSGRSSLEWTHLSSKNGDLLPPSNATQQTASLILDVDKDGVQDFVIGSRQKAPAMVWYQRNPGGWTKYLIDGATLSIEAGGAFSDIDGDGDLDVVMGGDYLSNRVWWWENPYPNYAPDTPWTRREIKSSGSNMHHDQIFGDFDGDGQTELTQRTRSPGHTRGSSRGVPVGSKGWPRRTSTVTGRSTSWVAVAGSSTAVARATRLTSLMAPRRSRERPQAS